MSETAPEASNRSIISPQLKIEHLWIMLPFVTIICRAFRTPLPLLDFWWHLKMGQVIFESGSIPDIDLFSFTAAGKPFVVQNWLAELAFYLVYLAGGLPLLVFLNAALLAAALLSVYCLCRESTRSLRIGILATIGASLMFFPNIRPQVFSLVLFALYYWVLDGFRFRRRNLLWLLPLLMVFWVNLHGAFILGLALVTLYLLCESARLLLQPSNPETLSATELGRLGLALLVCAIATLANPEIHRIYSYLYTVMTDKGSQLFVTEWQPPQIDAIAGSLLFFSPFFALLLTLLCSRRRPSLTDLALFLGFAAFGLTAIRNANWFVVISMPILARYLEAVDGGLLLQALHRIRPLDFMIRAIRRLDPGSPAPRYRLNLAIAGIAVAIMVLFSPWIRSRLYGASLVDPRTPVAAAAFIEQRGIKGNIFHPQIFGDYLIWRLYPMQRSFIDGRVHLFGEPFVQNYLRLFCDSNWEEKLREHDIRHLLLNKETGFQDCREMIGTARLSKYWTLSYEDAECVLFERRNTGMETKGSN